MKWSCIRAIVVGMIGWASLKGDPTTILELKDPITITSTTAYSIATPPVIVCEQVGNPLFYWLACGDSNGTIQAFRREVVAGSWESVGGPTGSFSSIIWISAFTKIVTFLGSTYPYLPSYSHFQNPDWSAVQDVNDTFATYYSPVTITQNNQYMAYVKDANAYYVPIGTDYFASNTPVQLNTVNNSVDSAVMIAGNFAYNGPQRYIAGWKDVNNNAVVVLWSGVWGTPIQLTSSGNVDSTVCVNVSSEGPLFYVASWKDAQGNAIVSVSTNGTTWTPKALAGNLLVTSHSPGPVRVTSAVYNALIQITGIDNNSDSTDYGCGSSYSKHGVGNDTCFVVTWIDNDYNAWASASYDGATWTVPIQLNAVGSPVSIGTVYQNAIGSAASTFVSVALSSVQDLLSITGTFQPCAQGCSCGVQNYSDYVYSYLTFAWLDQTGVVQTRPAYAYYGITLTSSGTGTGAAATAATQDMYSTTTAGATATNAAQQAQSNIQRSGT